MLDEKRWFAAGCDTPNRRARLSQLVPLGQLLALKHHELPTIADNLKTLIKVKRLTKYQRSQRRGDLGPPSTSAHWRACREKTPPNLSIAGKGGENRPDDNRSSHIQVASEAPDLERRSEPGGTTVWKWKKVCFSSHYCIIRTFPQTQDKWAAIGSLFSATSEKVLPFDFGSST